MYYAHLAQLVERVPCKYVVTGSNPVMCLMQRQFALKPKQCVIFILLFNFIGDSLRIVIEGYAPRKARTAA